MSKHTKGPWKAVRTVAPKGWVIGREDGLYDIAIVRDGSALEDNQANARLIAAAPDLLEALEDVRHNVDSDEPEMWHRVNAAIAKARGEVYE